MGASDPPPVNDNCGTGSNWRKACDFRDHDRGFATKGDAVMNRIHVAAAGMALAVTAVVIPVSAYAQAPLTIEGEALPFEYVGFSDLNVSCEAGRGEGRRWGEE